ncbi:MAG: CPBP family intramembrane metalloprotease [Candidatus Parcubacteria bacterium]|nr:CPBP family intramembrane metalloprotease [Candidatus Parcubacteria bacterium]
MKQIIVWLEEEATSKTALYYTTGATVFLLIWTPLLLTLLSLFGADIASIPDSTEKMANSSPFLVIFTILIEETIFRIIPLLLAVKNKFTTKGLLAISVVNSIIFGYIHGGALNILFPGVGGIVFCFLFLKCGGIKSNFFPACLAPVTSHLLYDAVRFAVVLS